MGDDDAYAKSPFAFEMKPNPVLFHYITPFTKDLTVDKCYRHMPIDIMRIEVETYTVLECGASRSETSCLRWRRIRKLRKRTRRVMLKFLMYIDNENALTAATNLIDEPMPMDQGVDRAGITYPYGERIQMIMMVGVQINPLPPNKLPFGCELCGLDFLTRGRLKYVVSLTKQLPAADKPQ